ncbi:hypothetical protein ACC720_39295, partial [Rhizobium ruizarguesonis]
SHSRCCIAAHLKRRAARWSQAVGAPFRSVLSRITTINVDCYGIGRQAAASLLDTLHTGEATGDEIKLTGYKVVLRES